jgi:hypothetical protein
MSDEQGPTRTEDEINRVLHRQHILNRHVLTTLLTKCQNGSDAFQLVQMYPSILHIQTKNKDLPIHLIARDTKEDRFFDRVESIIFQGIQDNVCGTRGCGGLMHKNARGLSPMASLSAHINCKHRRGTTSSLERQLIYLIQKISFHYLQMDRERKDNSDDADSPSVTKAKYEYTIVEASQVPALHAALDIGCPAYIIHLIQQEYCNEDSFDLQYNGMTPLQIAASSASASVEIFLMLLRRNPEMASRRNSNNECLLNQTIKTGPGRDKGPDIDDVCFIGNIVELSPESLLITDEVYGMHPFILAALAKWPTGIVFGLLRTNPCVLETYFPSV